MKRNRASGSISHRIQKNLVIPFLAFLLVSILLLLVYRDASLRQAKERYLYEDRLLSQSVTEEIRNVENCTNMIIIHLNELLDQRYLDESLCPLPNGSTQARIGKCMLDAFTTFENLNQILIIWDNGSLFYEDWTTNFFLSHGSGDLLRTLEDMELTQYGKWLPGVDLPPYLTSRDPVFAKAYYNIGAGRRTGYVLLKAAPIFQALDEVADNRKLFLENAEGTLIKSTFGAEDEDGAGREFTNTSRIGNLWKLTSRTDMSPDRAAQNAIGLRLLLLQLLLLVAVYFLTNRRIDRIIRPVRELSDHIAGSPDRLPEPIQMRVTDDEVGALVGRFNEMTRRNQELVSMLLEQKKRQEHLKLSLLQAQIKPHFLYNTLDTIYCLSEMGKGEEASRTTRLLSDYYRHVLSHGLDQVTLAEEVRQTRSYLEIQSIRYSDVLEYRIVFDEECGDVSIPKLTLQPLVENAIYHGIKPLNRRGYLVVSVHPVDGYVEIRVIDDGVGLRQEQLEKLIHEAGSEDAGFGLRSVYERLRLYYGNRFSMQVEMAEEHAEEGTCLLICIPAERGSECTE